MLFLYNSHSYIPVLSVSDTNQYTGWEEGEQEFSGKSGNLISMMKLCYTKGKSGEIEKGGKGNGSNRKTSADD